MNFKSVIEMLKGVNKVYYNSDRKSIEKSVINNEYYNCKLTHYFT